MKKILTLGLALLLIGLLWFLLSKPAVDPTSSAKSAKGAENPPSPNPVSKPPSVIEKARQLVAGRYPRWEGGRSIGLSDPRWDVVRAREEVDRAWQGKMPIDFFGKIIDFDGLPVEGATVKFSWTDLSPAGATQSTAKSDASGLFSLTNAVGKNLGVEVKKVGYYTAKQERYIFEYAAFYDKYFHQPDSSNPVIFRLKKKQTTDPLFYREQEVKVAIGSVSEATLDTGDKLQIELLTNSRPGQGQWSMRLSSPNGGLQAAVDEFPFLAPTDNYQSSLVLDNKTPKPPTWENPYVGGGIFLKTGSGYGRIEIRMISGRDWIRIKSWLNPSGSRNLEFDPAKVIKPQP